VHTRAQTRRLKCSALKGFCWRVRTMREKLTGAGSIPSLLDGGAAPRKSRTSEDDLSRDLSRPASTDTAALAQAGANAATAASENMPVKRVKGFQAQFQVG
jgi:hypothetical protein